MILIVVSYVTPPVTLHDAFEIFLYTHLRSLTSPPPHTHTLVLDVVGTAIYHILLMTVGTFIISNK